MSKRWRGRGVRRSLLLFEVDWRDDLERCGLRVLQLGESRWRAALLEVLFFLSIFRSQSPLPSSY